MPLREHSIMSQRLEFVARVQALRPLRPQPPSARQPAPDAACGGSARGGTQATPPCLGGRKLARRLRDLGHTDVPAPSTVTAILRRHGLLDGPRAGELRAFTRFEHERPNQLWQMDFKGHVPCGVHRCHPLTVLDDCSRYNVTLAACPDERTATVRGRLEQAFRLHGLPERIAVDNGPPWGWGPGQRYTPLTVWLLRLGVRVSHSRPYHPQTLGKDERFHRTLREEALVEPLADLASAQRRFDHWREVYNRERPHEALDGEVPAARYRPSERLYPETLPPIEYGPDDLVRKVGARGITALLGRAVRLPKAFRGEYVAFRPSESDGRFTVYFATIPIAEVDLTVDFTTPSQPVRYLPEHPSDISLV